MQLAEFQILSKRTMASLGSIELDLSHCIIGMLSELEELEQAIINKDMINVSEEGVDVEFYLVNYCTFRELNVINIPIIPVKNCSLLNLTTTLSKLSDLTKKYIAYKKEINRDKELELLSELFSKLECMFKAYGINMENALQNNVDKLKIRFPISEGFTENRANNRDLMSERKELEKQ